MALFKSIPTEVIDVMKKLHVIILVVALIVVFIAGFTAAVSVVLAIFIFITAIVPMFLILGLAIAAIFSGLAIAKVDIK